ncbi:hypothetical protein RHS03_00363, partial [Rhizoctonia solani]
MLHILQYGRFAMKPAESQNSDLAGASSESRDDRFMPCRLASDLLHHLASYTGSAAARLCMSFLSRPPSFGHESWFGPSTHEPGSRSGAPGPASLLCSRGGSPTFTGPGLVADADDRAEDKFSPLWYYARKHVPTWAISIIGHIISEA